MTREEILVMQDAHKESAVNVKGGDMSNVYMVEVQITLPRGESLDDWGNVGHFFEDVRGDKPGVGLLKVSSRISRAVAQFEEAESKKVSSDTTSVDEPKPQTRPSS